MERDVHDSDVEAEHELDEGEHAKRFPAPRVSSGWRSHTSGLVRLGHSSGFRHEAGVVLAAQHLADESRVEVVGPPGDQAIFDNEGSHDPAHRGDFRRSR